MKKTRAGKSGKNDVVDEVEMLLQSAHDELILKMSVDSHASRVGASSNLHPDLHRRFLALKSQPSSSSSIPQDLKPKKNIHAASGDSDDLKAVLGDDLSARFAALKSSITTPSPPVLQGEAAPNKPFHVREDDDDEDEVEKLIQWAMDAARLDPSPPSDSDADEKDDEEEDQIDSPSYSSSSDDENLEKKKKKDPTKSNK